MATHRHSLTALPKAKSIDSQLAKLHTAVDKTWKSVLMSKGQTMRRLASLRRLKAFRSARFTDTEKYIQGRKALSTFGAQELQECEDARCRRFRDWMGPGDGRTSNYLSREMLASKEGKAVFRKFRRRFGEGSDLTSKSHWPKKPSITVRQYSPEAKKRGEINRFVMRRMGSILQSNSMSKGAEMIRDAFRTGKLKQPNSPSLSSMATSPTTAGLSRPKRVIFSPFLSAQVSPRASP